MTNFEIGDEVIVAENNRQTYRADVIKVKIVDITRTPKTIKYHLSNGENVMSVSKMWKLG